MALWLTISGDHVKQQSNRHDHRKHLNPIESRRIPNDMEIVILKQIYCDHAAYRLLQVQYGRHAGT